jgi:hypothetical protein
MATRFIPTVERESIDLVYVFLFLLSLHLQTYLFTLAIATWQVSAFSPIPLQNLTSFLSLE